MISSIIVGIIGFLTGLFGFSNIALPLFFILPKAIKMVRAKVLKKDVILKCLIAPIIWVFLITILYLLAAHFRYGKEFIGCVSLGIVFHILGLFKKETQNDIKEEYEEFIKVFKVNNE